MFAKLAGLLANNQSVTLLLSGNPDEITVTVLPKPAKVKEGQEALATPLVLTGTPAELDESFADLVAQFTDKRKSLAEQFAATESVLEAAQKASVAKATKGVTATAKSAAKQTLQVSSTGDDDDDDSLTEGGSDSPAPAATAGASTTPSDNLFAV